MTHSSSAAVGPKSRSAVQSPLIAKHMAYDMTMNRNMERGKQYSRAVYANTNEIADTVIRTYSPTHAGNTPLLQESTIVELKCQSRENFKNFRANVAADIKKLAKLERQAFVPRGMGRYANHLAVAISVDDDGLLALEEMFKKDKVLGKTPMWVDRPSEQSLIRVSYYCISIDEAVDQASLEDTPYYTVGRSAWANPDVTIGIDGPRLPNDSRPIGKAFDPAQVEKAR